MPSPAEERRPHPRYELDNSVLVLANGIFQVTDLSSGGLCFKCPPYTSIDDFWEADILTSAENLGGFPGKRVWVSIPENGSHEFLPIVVGAKFGRLTKKQNGRLSQLIKELSRNNSSEK